MRILALSGLILSLHAAGSLPEVWSLETRESSEAARVYELEVQPILVEHCYDCHAYGASEGNLTLDHFQSAEDATKDPDLWWRVLKNMRAGVMPPADSSKLSAEEKNTLNEWIKMGPFAIDPESPDPGPITVRRLNRAEYGNTIRQLMGIPFDENLIFPPDDSGHGFDNVADALMVSPLLLEKYLQAAEQVVEQAVPTVTRIVPRQDLDGSQFRSTDGQTSGRHLDGKKPAKVSRTLDVDEAGEYSIQFTVRQGGSFEFDPAQYRVTGFIDEKECFETQLGWDENKRSDFTFQQDWEPGNHTISIELTPVEPDKNEEDLLKERSGTHVRFEIQSVSVEGPLGTERRVHPANYERFFTRDAPPEDRGQWDEYADEVLRRFASRAFRGNADDATVARLKTIAQQAYSQPETTFEAGIARAMVATLVSPKFLFRLDETQAGTGTPLMHAPVTERSLATRLSYFLWASMPDEELMDLAAAGELRQNLEQQIDRMLDDPRSDAFVDNFVGQWLRTRDVPKMAIDPAIVLGYATELEELRDWFRTRFRRRGRGSRGEMSEEDQAKLARFREIRETVDRVDGDLKQAMRRETEMLLEYVIRNDVSMLDLLDCDYTFLNEKLAEHYDIDGVAGDRMRRVFLPVDSPRGGVLTQASMLMVTSNPTRTSPVKRGLFVLDNILGTPAPPAPGVVPELEESANRFPDREPTLRELLEVHRESELCSSCHARMDPLGFALENFDALGMWRQRYGDSEIEPNGVLVTGEAFNDIRDLKQLLRDQHADDFFRCVSEKLLIFAIGRGIEYSDEHCVDQILEQTKSGGGTFRQLVHAVVNSSPFQRQRLSASQSPVVSQR